MGRVYDEIDERLAGFLTSQPVFFVATAPLAADGHVNLSPKGMQGSFAVTGPRKVAYLDLTGSGVETIAHLQENGRICMMFCAFAGPPRIVRVHGKGTPHLAGTNDFDDLVTRFPQHPGVRAVVEVDVDRISDSCGYAVPLMAYERDRDQLDEWADRRGPDGIVDYWAEKNASSLDGLPGLP